MRCTKKWLLLLAAMIMLMSSVGLADGTGGGGVGEAPGFTPRDVVLYSATGRTLVEIRTHAVFVRNKPRGEEFGTAKYWQRYLYLGEQTDDRGKLWYQIQYGDRVGFVTSEYCTVIYEAPDGTVTDGYGPTPTPGPTPAPVPGTPRTLVEVRSHAVNVRKGPGLSYESMGTVHHWERYVYLGEQYDARPVLWYKIQWGTSEGWVSSKYCTPIQE